ncbi:MAG: YkgJ family cysteine cluster protein, partial [Planctomycetota bacterium]
HQLTPDLKSEWQAFVSQYQLPEYGNEPSSFDGPCIWLNMETRLCKHHQFRPSVCRDFDAGSRDCHDWRRYYQDQIETPPNDT